MALQWATYDQMEASVESRMMNDGLGTHVTTSLAVGFVADLPQWH